MSWRHPFLEGLVSAASRQVKPSLFTAAALSGECNPVRLCVVSFKECWQDDAGTWMSSGGFPAQMAALGTLFDELTLVIVGSQPQAGGIPLPRHAHVVPLRRPVGNDTRRKISVLANLRYYLSSITRHVQAADVVHTPVPGDLPFLGMLVAAALRKRLFAM